MNQMKALPVLFVLGCTVFASPLQAAPLAHKRPVQSGLSFWPFKPPKIPVSDPGLDSLPASLLSVIQRAFDRLSDVVYYAGCRDTFTVILVIELAIAALILLCMKAEIRPARAVGLTLLTAIVLWYASQVGQSSSNANGSRAAQRTQQHFGVTRPGGHR